jgi:hypothetical protein
MTVAAANGMHLTSRARRGAVIAVVVTGAVASIATTRLFAVLQASLDLPALQLSQATPSATYRVHIAATGSGPVSFTELLLTARTTSPVPTMLGLASSVDAYQDSVPVENTQSDVSVTIRCDALPCEDDVMIRIQLAQRADGSWPAPSDWTLHVDLQLEIDGTRDVPPGASASLKLVP